MLTCVCGNMTDREMAWLIEGDGNYWDGKYADSRGFTRDINKAVRFARLEDAEIVKHWLLQQHSFALRTSQHIWINAKSDVEEEA
jgi:hypothetical protein